MADLAQKRPERELVTAWIPTRLAERLAEAAREGDRSKSSVVRRALNAYLRQTTDTEEAA